MQPTCTYDTARRLAEHWMEALLLQIVVLGARWLIPRLAQHAPTRMEVNDPSVFVRTHKGPTDQAEHHHVGETFSKVSWPDSQRGVGGHQNNPQPVSFFHYIRQYMSYEIARYSLRFGMEILNEGS